jgi:hypothetical protein
MLIRNPQSFLHMIVAIRASALMFKKLVKIHFQGQISLAGALDFMIVQAGLLTTVRNLIKELSVGYSNKLKGEEAAYMTDHRSPACSF